MNTKLQKEKSRFRLPYPFENEKKKKENVFDRKDLLFLWRFIWSNSTKIHVIEHTWFPNTHSSCSFYDNSRLKNFVFVFFS
jgi:hypothetical protein